MTIGLTGGIGSGKSMVARVFELLGAAIFNSDDEAKLCYYNPEIKVRIIELLGPEAYSETGEINRGYIANSIFGNESLLQKINGIIHPAVKARMLAFEQKYQNKLIVKESALLFEAHLESTVNKIVVVSAPLELRIKRSMLRDGISRLQIEERIAKQWPQDEKIKNAHYVIDNSEQVLVLPQVLNLYQKLIH